LQYSTRAIDQKMRRLIPSRFPPVDVYERLGSPELARAAVDSENRTNPRLQSREWLIKGPLAVHDKSPRLQNWNHAPFAYKNPEGSTFLNPAYGVLEVVDSIKAALAMAVLRREVFLGRTSEPPMYIDMRMLVTKVTGSFIDLTDLPPDLPTSDRWQIGRELYEQEASGVLFRKPELGDAICLSVFAGQVLGPTEQGAHYRFDWDGQRIRSIYDFSPPGSVISRSSLLSGGQEAA
jgi:hypothetical protein